MTNVYTAYASALSDPGARVLAEKYWTLDREEPRVPRWTKPKGKGKGTR